MSDTSQLFKQLPKVNNHPFGEFSPNLVTLLPVRFVSVNQPLDFYIRSGTTFPPCGKISKLCRTHYWIVIKTFLNI
jgi:hypothetical protein